ncbi:hypothetical protein ABAC460_14215 [Asticcacaulis sp. AC460]|uniref:EF-hand domain-containing protein n=1 Tax=Asticcacaulis sp. AC460 TaxID=1282360 RepID=UPI0003C401F9|nr:EF-hand domain-containing protein [Asticcacaulis sp. AC460]ESQ88932.1 hypothetical protein ABAC460_14215 [Asticcacaulis sp. AC460]
MNINTNQWATSGMGATSSFRQTQSQSGAGEAPSGPKGPPPSGPPPSEGMSMSDETLAGLVGVQQAQGQGFTPPAFEDIDTDGDGGISQTEMQAFGQTRHADETTEKADALFSEMDEDGDGTVTAQEKTAFDETRGPGKAPPPGSAPPEATASESDSTDSSAKLAVLMQELMTALEAYSGTAASTETATTTTTSVAA